MHLLHEILLQPQYVQHAWRYIYIYAYIHIGINHYSPELFTCPKSMATTMDVRALANNAAQALGYNSLKEDKMKVVLAIVGG